MTGRVKTYEAIIKGENITEPGIPESFKVLLKELQSLALDVRVLRDDQTEVEIGETVDYTDDEEYRNFMESQRNYVSADESFGDYGYREQTVEGDEIVDVDVNGTADDSEDFDLYEEPDLD